jgi:hypothetical protein
MSLDLSLYRRGTHPVSSGAAEHDPGDSPWRSFGPMVRHPARGAGERRRGARRGCQPRRVKEEWEVGRAGAHLFGYLELDSSRIQTDLNQLRMFDQTGTLDRWQTGYGGFNPEVVGLRMGVVHSNDSAFALRLIVMPMVLVCSNGMTVSGGSIACQKRHTKGLDLVPALDAGIRTFLDRTERIEGTIERLKEIDFSSLERADHLIVEAGRRRIMPWSALGKVEKAWREPPHPEFDERTGWSLYNAFTEVAKSFSMKNEMRPATRCRRLILVRRRT